MNNNLPEYFCDRQLWFFALPSFKSSHYWRFASLLLWIIECLNFVLWYLLETDVIKSFL